MAALTVQVILPSTLLVPTLAAAGVAGDTFKNTGKETFRIKNAGAASRDVTFVCSGGSAANPRCSFGVAATPGHDIVKTIANDSSVYEIGPFPTYFNDGNGNLNVTYSAVTSVTVAVVVAPPNA